MRNRIIVPPMATAKADDQGLVTDALVDHYRLLAWGGAAMVIVEHAYVVAAGRLRQRQLSVCDDACIPGLEQVAREIRDAGALAVLQLNHAGSRAPLAVTGVTSRGASGIPVPGDFEAPLPMSTLEIEDISRLFGEAAARAAAAGFHGVEVHGAHGYLLNEFASPYTNRRSDQYGGDAEGRLRLPCEVLSAVRAVLGGDAPLLYRFGCDDGLDTTLGQGLTSALAAQMAPSLAACGVDLLDCSGGLCGSRPPGPTTQGYFIPAAALIRKAVTVPVAGVGGITEPAYAERVVREGLVDAVCVGRAHLADPGWAGRALATLASDLSAPA